MHSSSGFQTRVWGAPMWLTLHMISLNYKPDMKHGYRAFFNSLQHVLPCGACRVNYRRIIHTVLPLNDEVFSCRRSMAMWVFLLHNQVQKDIYAKTQDPHDIPLYKDTLKDFKRAMAFYEQYRAKCVRDSHGCVVPLKGARKRSKIDIVKYSQPRKANAIANRE